MAKDFGAWSNDKSRLHTEAPRPFYHAREIWWCAVGTNIGSEIDGTGARYDRPVVVVRGFNTDTFFGVALSARPHTGRFYFSLGQVSGREAVANLSQARLYDTKRLLRKMGTLDETTFAELSRALALTLFPSLPLK